ncbi:hypothetical protein PC121_g3873 [Phytophthora cactorum]|nr:hypothetical protein PC121_g3873 [Phytophthora cactorum]
MRPGSGPRIPTYTVRVVQQVQEERVKQQIDISPPPAQDRKQSSDDPMPAFVSTNPSQAASQMIMVHHRVEEQLLCDREVWVIFQKVEREWVSGIVQNSPRVCGKQRGPVIRSSRYPVIGRGAAARGVRRGKSHPRGNRGRRSQSSHNQGPAEGDKNHGSQSPKGRSADQGACVEIPVELWAEEEYQEEYQPEQVIGAEKPEILRAI